MTKRRRQVTYLDDDNLKRAEALKKLQKLTTFFNWTLRNNIETFMLEEVYKESNT